MSNQTSSSSSSSAAAYLAYLSSISPLIGFWSSAIITSIGILSSFVETIVFFASKSLNKTNMGYLYGWLSLFALLTCLADYSSSFFGSQTIKLNYSLISDAACKLNNYILRIFPHFASWFQAYVTFDRYIQMKYPAKAHLLKKKLFVNLAILMIVVLCLVANIANFWYFIAETLNINVRQVNQTETVDGTNENSNGSIQIFWLNQTRAVNVTTIISINRICTATSQVSSTVEVVTLAMRTWIPFALIIFFSIQTIRLLKRSGKRAGTANQNSRSRKEKEFTRTVLKISFIFFIMHFPLSIAWIVFNCYRSFSPNQTPLGQISILIFIRLSIALGYAYQSISFYINLAFNKPFRGEMLRIVRLIRCQKVSLDSSSSSISYMSR